MRGKFMLLFLLSGMSAYAQSDSLRTSRMGYAFLGQGGFNPGVTVTWEKTLIADDRYQFLVAAKSGLYFHYRNNTGFLLMVQAGHRFRISKHLYFEDFLGVGFLQTFLNGGDAYYVTASGQISKASKIGNPHFMPSVSFGLSYEITARTMVFARPMIYWQIPFNQTSLVQYAFEAGASIKMKAKKTK